MSVCRQRGFSLVELSVVILIMGLLLGGLVLPLAVQRDNARMRDGMAQLESAREAVEGFALVNGHLPCPATAASDGYAALAGGGCAVQHGFVPATTLGLTGRRNADNLLLDPWGSPLRYSVTASDQNGNGNWDFVTPAEAAAVTMPLLTPDLVVCGSAAGSSASACANANLTLTARAPAVFYSLGKDWASFGSPDQQENVGATLAGGASGERYAVAADVVFVQRQKSEQTGSEFDDLVLWLPHTVLLGRLVEAGHLP